MTKGLWVLLTTMFVAPLTSAEIYKCAAKDGMDLYQNFPCQFDSMGSIPTNAQGTKTPSAPANSSQTTLKAVPLEIEVAGRSLALPTEPRIGMTAKEVKAIWGEPMSSYQDELVEGRVEVSPHEHDLRWQRSPTRHRGPRLSAAGKRCGLA